MILHSLTITVTGNVVPLSATRLAAKFVQAVTAAANSANVLIGGNEVTSSVGFPLPPNFAGQMLPPISEISEFYDLSLINAYLASGDVLYLLYGG